MNVLIVLIGSSGDRLLSRLHRTLVRDGWKVSWVNNLIDAQLTVPIANVEEHFKIQIDGQTLTFDESSILLVAETFVQDSVQANHRNGAYRRVETFAVWTTFLALFPGRVVNRPDRLAAPVQCDPLLVRSFARALNVPTLPDLITNLDPPEAVQNTYALVDLASGITVWGNRDDNNPRAIVSYLSYSPDAEHRIVVRTPTASLVCVCGLGRKSEFISSDECSSITKATDAICKYFSLDYAYAVFIRQDDEWLFTRLFLSPPPAIDDASVDIICEWMMESMQNYVRA